MKFSRHSHRDNCIIQFIIPESQQPYDSKHEIFMMDLAENGAHAQINTKFTDIYSDSFCCINSKTAEREGVFSFLEVIFPFLFDFLILLQVTSRPKGCA